MNAVYIVCVFIKMNAFYGLTMGAERSALPLSQYKVQLIRHCIHNSKTILICIHTTTLQIANLATQNCNHFE